MVFIKKYWEFVVVCVVVISCWCWGFWWDDGKVFLCLIIFGIFFVYYGYVVFGMYCRLGLWDI